MELEIKINQQGAPRVNAGAVYRSGADVVALEIDLHSKYCEVVATGGSNAPQIFIGTNESSLHLDETKDRNESTAIEFPQFVGWSVWATTIGRYTLAVCLTRDMVETPGIRQGVEEE